VSTSSQPRREAEPSASTGDQPLHDVSQDRLGRAGFVALLAEEIEGAPRGGFVIGVTGAWGTGKTSVINMAVNPLATRAGFRVLRFNPWLFSGTPQLIEHFFAELAGQLRAAGKRRKGERLSQLGDAIESYGAVLDPLRFAPAVDKVTRWSGFFGRLLKALGRNPGSALEQKAAIDDLLRDHNEVLVVVIDDIDRLEQAEVRDIVRLVRLVGDFPNVVYVLAYSTDVVARALGTGRGDEARVIADGYAYLEKIVQVTHAVPSIDREDMSKLVLSRLEESLEGVEYEIDREHWSRVYDAIRDNFKTLRDVLRYCNAVRAPVRHLSPEVTAADIFGLEALRMFEANVWEQLPLLSPALTATSDSYMLDADRKADEEKIKALVGLAANRKAVEQLLAVLFPAISRLFGGSGFGSDWQGEWRRSGRVAHADVLRTYLTRQVPSDRASRAQTQAVVAAFADPPVLRSLLAGIDDEKLPSLLSRIEDYESELGLDALEAIPVLYEVLPRLPKRTGGFFDIEPEIRIGRVVYRIVKDQVPDALAVAIAPVIERLPLLSDRISVIRTLGWQSQRSDPLVDGEALDAAALKIASDALQRSAQQLAGEYSLGLVISAVERHFPEQTSQWIAARIGHVPLFVRLLTTYMREVRNAAGRHTQLLWDRLGETLGEDRLITAVRDLPSDDAWFSALDEDEQAMVSQARRFAADPEEARRIMEDQRSRYG
jgi:predicted KAP-like P-loop ATPase